MPAWIAPVVGSLVAGAVGYKGAQQQNKINQREAQKNRDFQERMRNTQWQSAVEDMRQAGINPALAYQQGPNAAPGGSQAAPATSPINSGIQAVMARKQLQLLNSQVEKTNQEGREARARATLALDRQQYLTNRFEANGYRSTPLLYDMIDAELDGLRLGVEGQRINNARNAELRDIAGVGGDLARTFGMWGPILGSLAAPGGIGVNSARGLTNYLRRRAAVRALNRKIR